MRRLPFLAALAAALALAGCTLKTPEGAACDQIGGVDQCPDGQRCGADGTCSVAAVACGPTICSGTVCEDGKLRACVPSAGSVCASFEDTPCADHQTCDAVAGTCTCADSICDGTRTSLCDGLGTLVTCGSGSQSSCPYEVQREPCGRFKECKDVVGVASSTCGCKDDPENCKAIGTKCSSFGEAVVTCNGEGACFVAESVVPCATGEVCGVDSGSARCDCPAIVDPPADLGSCLTENALACNGTTLLKCVPVVGSLRCKAWTKERNCAGSGLVCGISPTSGSTACVCPALASPKTLFVDPLAPGELGIEPNGADNAICRFKTLVAALAPPTAFGDTVKASGNAPLTFREPGFAVPAGVTLVGDESSPVVPANVVVEVQSPGLTGIKVEAGASVSGFTVRKAAGAEALVGVEVTGGSAVGGPSLADIRVDKVDTTEAFGTGVAVTGSGAVALERVHVESATGAGLQVARDGAAEAVTVTTSAFIGNNEGVRLVVGDLSLTSPTVTGNTQNGVNASPASGTDSNRSLTLSGGLVARNGATGVYALRHARLRLEGNHICLNAGLVRPLGGTSRTVGGVYFQGSPPAELSFKGNRLHDNGGDQLFVGGSTPAWDVSGDSRCLAATTNVLINSASGVGLVAVGAPVTARFTAWSSNDGPLVNVDYAEFSGTVNVGGVGEYCFPPSLPLDCPQ